MTVRDGEGLKKEVEAVSGGKSSCRYRMKVESAVADRRWIRRLQPEASMIAGQRRRRSRRLHCGATLVQHIPVLHISPLPPDTPLKRLSVKASRKSTLNARQGLRTSSPMRQCFHTIKHQSPRTISSSSYMMTSCSSSQLTSVVPGLGDGFTTTSLCSLNAA